MYNVTANAPIINAFTAPIQALVAIGMLSVTFFLWRSAVASKNYVQKQTEIMGNQLKSIQSQTQNFEKQTKLMNLQAGYAEKQTEIMDKQVSFLNEQKAIMDNEAKAMKEDREYHMLIEKYRRLRDEMDKLVAPLYFAAHTPLAENNDSGYFVDIDPRWRNNAPSKQNLVLFWDEIRKNMHLSQSDKLIELLQKHFEYNDDYYSHLLSSNGDPKERKQRYDNALTKFNSNRTELIDEIQKNSYPTLKRELDEIELKLGIR